MTEAVAFVLGAVVVGGIALLRELFVDRRRWQREQDAYDRVTRAARRLVADELDSAQSSLRLMLTRDAWPAEESVGDAGFPPTGEWERDKSRLAEAVDENTWVVLAAFYYSLTTLRRRARVSESSGPLSEMDREFIRSMQDQATVLRAVLGEGAPLPDNWHEQLRALQAAAQLPVVDKPQPRSS